jgi:hypothetical protein
MTRNQDNPGIPTGLNDGSIAPSDQRDERLVTVFEGRSEFEANAIAATLRNLGFYAAVVNTGHSTLPIQGIHRTGVPVWVRERDLTAAAAALQRNRADSVDIDWADVDVGQMEDGAPPAAPTIAPRIGGYGPGWRAIRNFGFIAMSLALAMFVIPRGYAIFAVGMAIFLWGVSLFDQDAIRRARQRMGAKGSR